MPPPGPFTLFAQSFAAALMSWWMRLFLGREERAMMESFFAKLHGTMGRLDDIFAMWKAGTLPPPPPEPEPRQVAVRKPVAGQPRRVRGLAFFPAPRGREDIAPQEADRPMRRAVAVRFAVRPFAVQVGPRVKRRELAVPRVGEWSG